MSMLNQKGIAPILIIIVLAALAVAGVGSAAVFGEAPKCPTDAGNARSEKEIGDILEKGSVTINDREATTLGRGYVGQAIDNLRVCFTPGLGHVSGRVKLGPVSPSFYASAAVDLSGSYPKATNLDIKVGALPKMPLVSDQASKVVTDLINQNLAKIKMNSKYSTDFVSGSVTINKVPK